LGLSKAKKFTLINPKNEIAVTGRNGRHDMMAKVSNLA
jgi:hypothetical protein